MPLKWQEGLDRPTRAYESAGVFDVNGDGVLDIVSGGFWYQGPDFRKKHAIGAVKACGEYYDDFSTIPMDVNGDGRTGLHHRRLVGQHAALAREPRRPGARSGRSTSSPRPATSRPPAPGTSTATACSRSCPTRPATPRGRVYKLDHRRQRQGHRRVRRARDLPVPGGQGQGHGLGCGDIAGNGRMDIVLCQRLAGGARGPVERRVDAGTRSSSLGSAQRADPGGGRERRRPERPHRRQRPRLRAGLVEQRMRRRRSARGSSTPSTRSTPSTTTCSGSTSTATAQCELVTGKRHRAHCGNEAGEWDDLGIYYFKWTGEGFAKQVIDYGPIGDRQGLRHPLRPGRPARHRPPGHRRPGKDGLYVFFNEGP